MTAAPVLHFPQEGHRQMHLQPRRPAENRQQINSRDLWKWVDLLTRDRKEKLRRRGIGQRKATVEHVDVPSLWTQMVEALASSNSGGGHGKASTGSRSPMNLALAALVMEMESAVIDGLTELGAKPRAELEDTPTRSHPLPTPRLLGDDGLPLLDPDTAGRLVERARRSAADVQARPDSARIRHDTRSDLRQLATLAVGSGAPDVVDRWARRYRYWVNRAEEALTLDDESIHMRGARGRPCPCCLALWVTSERDGEQFRDPALVAEFRDGWLLHLLCRACGADWRDDVDELTQWIAENEAEFGDASQWGLTVPRKPSDETTPRRMGA